MYERTKYACRDAKNQRDTGKQGPWSYQQIRGCKLLNVSKHALQNAGGGGHSAERQNSHKNGCSSTGQVVKTSVGVEYVAEPHYARRRYKDGCLLSTNLARSKRDAAYSLNAVKKQGLVWAMSRSSTYSQKLEMKRDIGFKHRADGMLRHQRTPLPAEWQSP